MRNKLWVCLALVLIVPGLLTMVSCETQNVKTDDQSTSEGTGTETGGTEAGTTSSGEGTISATGEFVPGKTFANEQDKFFKELVYFEYDKSTLTENSQKTLTFKAEYMRKNPNLSISVEGHCDERGTNEYNLSLGDRRAASTKAFLVDLGVDPGRISSVSFGEERPDIEGHDEMAWAKNRRAAVAGSE